MRLRSAAKIRSTLSRFRHTGGFRRGTPGAILAEGSKLLKIDRAELLRKLF